MELSLKFQMLRISKGISVYKLSKISDVSENYIRTIEKGSGQPSVHIIEKLLKCLGTTIAEFFNENDEVMYPTAFERELVECVRVLDDEKSAALLHLVKLLAK